MSQQHAPTIAHRNDTFRRTTPRIMLTPGVQALPDIPELIDAVRNFDIFTPGNDPYGEHDFGAIDWHRTKIFWKIDYYDQALQYGGNPLSPDCRRVLTIYLASEH